MTVHGPATPHELTLSSLLGGMASDTFLSEYWSRRPLVLKRGNPDFYRAILSIREIDALLFAARFRPGEIRIARSGEGIELQTRGTNNFQDPVSIPTIYRHFAAGRTLVLHLLEQRWKPLGIVTHMLERALRCPVHANAYLTPAGEQGYPVHYDDHDFFIFQLDGVKRWRIYEPHPTAVLPIKVKSQLPYGGKASQLETPLLYDLEVEPGDLLYVPRGFIHYAEAGSAPTLHLTIGVHAMTWYTLLEASLSRAALLDERLRHNVPLRIDANGDGRADLSAAASLLPDLDARGGLAEWNNRLLGMNDALPDGHFAAVAGAPSIEATTMLRRRDSVEGGVFVVAGQAVLRYLDQAVIDSADLEPLYRALLSREPYCARTLPAIIDEDARVLLLRKLVENGFLTFANTPPPGIVAARQEDTGHASKELEETMSTQTFHDTPATNDPAAGHVAPQSEGKPCCSACAAAGPDTRPRYVYAIGNVSARFPSEDIEKEVLQAVRGADTQNLTDRQVLHRILSDPANAYIAREMCWVFSIGQLDAYILAPRSGIELADLIDSLKVSNSGGSTETSAIIGIRSAGNAAPSTCNGLELPVVAVSKVYTFDINEFFKQIPNNEGKDASARELLDRLTHMIDNVGELDEHRAINYLGLRYPGIYNLVAENYGKSRSLTAINAVTHHSRNRRIVDVVFTFVDRATDVEDRYMTRVDVTGQFPFLVSKLRPVFEMTVG
jgi:hypothetical protein